MHAFSSSQVIFSDAMQVTLMHDIFPITSFTLNFNYVYSHRYYDTQICVIDDSRFLITFLLVLLSVLLNLNRFNSGNIRRVTLYTLG